MAIRILVLISSPRVLYAFMLLAIGARDRAKRIIDRLGTAKRSLVLSGLIYDFTTIQGPVPSASKIYWEVGYQYMRLQSEFRPDSPHIWLWLGTIQRELGLYSDAALSLYHSSMTRGDAPTSSVYFQRGKLALNLGDPHEALEWFTRAQNLLVAKKSKSYSLLAVRLAIGSCHWEMGDENSSVRIYCEVVQSCGSLMKYVPVELRRRVSDLVKAGN